MGKVAGNAVPLLLGYGPGFTADFLHPPGLPWEAQMTRLQAIKLYLSRQKASMDSYLPSATRIGSNPMVII